MILSNSGFLIGLTRDEKMAQAAAVLAPSQRRWATC